MRTLYLIFTCIVLLYQPAYLSAANFSPAPDFDQKDALNASQTAAFGTSSTGGFLPVEQAYILNAEFESPEQLRLNWQIAEGYYLYRHSFEFKIMDGDKPVAVTTTIPDGLSKNDEYFGLVEVYYHNTDVMINNIPSDSALRLTVTSQGCADAGLCYPPYSEHFLLNSSQNSISKVEPNNQATGPLSINTSRLASPTEHPSLLYMLLFAILGGIILNLMPCVFPILSLKVLAFANDKNHSQVVHGLAYSGGVITSFIAVAALLISLQAAGSAIGWGFHLQSPWFVAALTYLFFIMGLSLSGFVEFGGQLMNTGNSLAAKSGYSGSFFTGILATVVASPCTAPFMGTALGFAVTQPTGTALLVFAALGLGMAIPVLILSASPKLLNKIPKPGPWMEQLKQFLAFPLYATAVWLAWVVGNQTGVNGMATLLMGCVLLTLAIWLWRGKTAAKVLATACTIAALIALTSPLLQTKSNTDQEWLAYSPQRLADLRRQGKPVFINVTADWCITCLANEKITLSTDKVKQALLNSGVTYLKADWTNYDAAITELLKQYDRTGIPLYIIYPADNSPQGKVLPQILTTAIVLDAIDAATP
ncbi:MAG: protein-disulfide reductase DsbD [Spongiibacteraceae bacterium]